MIKMSVSDLMRDTFAQMRTEAFSVCFGVFYRENCSNLILNIVILCLHFMQFPWQSSRYPPSPSPPQPLHYHHPPTDTSKVQTSLPPPTPPPPPPPPTPPPHLFHPSWPISHPIAFFLHFFPLEKPSSVKRLLSLLSFPHTFFSIQSVIFPKRCMTKIAICMPNFFLIFPVQFYQKIDSGEVQLLHYNFFIFTQPNVTVSPQQ